MNEPFNNFTLPIFGINFLFHSLMIEKALLVYRRRLDKKKQSKTKQCITQNHELKNAQEKKKRRKKKKKRTVKELVSSEL